jgi:hypothetical protein
MLSYSSGLHPQAHKINAKHNDVLSSPGLIYAARQPATAEAHAFALAEL